MNATIESLQVLAIILNMIAIQMISSKDRTISKLSFPIFIIYQSIWFSICLMTGKYWMVLITIVNIVGYFRGLFNYTIK